MSSPLADPVAPARPVAEDDPMQGSGAEEQEEGEERGAISDDSSEEPEEDEEEARRVREGFIVDEDEEEEEDEEDPDERRRKKKRRKRRHRRDRDEEALEEDDLELLEENTGASFKHRLTRLRRGHGADSPPAPSSSRRKAVVESSDDDIDNDDLELPKIQDIHNIWDDERAAGRDDEDDADMDDMDGFIDDDEDDQGGALDEEEREERRRERRRLEKERRKALGSRELPGIDASAWDEIYEVFGDGHDYDWALEGDEETGLDDEMQKLETRYQDVFEPSEIKARMLTEDDDVIRAHDTPERMQLATSSLSQSSTLSLQNPLTENDLDDAASWVITRLGQEKEKNFFRPNGEYHQYLSELVQAITYALRYLFIQEFEVPYIWAHKRDYICYFNPQDMRRRVELLTLHDLWRIYAVGQKYRSLLERRKALDALYTRLGVTDDYFENEIRKRVETVETVADATEWLGLKHRDDKKQQFEFHFHDDEEAQPETKKRKMPSRVSAYEVAKKSIVSKLAQGFGIQPQEVVLNFLSGSRTHFVEEQDTEPLVFADQFVDPDPTKALTPEELLRRARMILATELGKDPILRQEMRNRFKAEALISVRPTERGIAKIDEFHPFFNFKYLENKPAFSMLESPQFLHILAAEAEHLVTVSVTIPAETKADFERRLADAFSSDTFSDTARVWNEERLRVVQETLEQHLLPVAVKWTREWIRDQAEEYLCHACATKLRERIDVAPYKPHGLADGDVPSVLAMSWGKGDPQKDAIMIVFLDEAGRLREHTRIDNLVDDDNREEFKDIMRRRRPDVIVVSGFSIATTKLSQRVKELLRPPARADDEFAPATPAPSETWDTDVIYVFDEVARIYQHSKRADEEFSALSPLAKYCVGLARYTQSPLGEYAALGSDITAITFDEDYQQLLPKEKLLTALERVLVDVTNKVGVDINRAVTDAYYQHLLPFVCGLGPRKAQVLVRKIAAMGGTLVNRDQFIRGGLLTTKIFLNATAFLRIVQDSNLPKPSKNRHGEDNDVPDPLDSTRIHPEDYELARKMATDALELDEEDVHDEHPSHVVSLIMNDADNEKKLDELNLDDFAVNMFETNQDRKRRTLSLIRDELVHPFHERRKAFRIPINYDVLTMLCGETFRTLRVGLVVSVQVTRPNRSASSVRLDSGVEGSINSSFYSDDGNWSNDAPFKKGQTITAVVIDTKFNSSADSFYVELSARPSDVSVGDAQFRRVKHDEMWEHAQYDRDMEMLARKKRAEVDKTRRVIKHPNFHNFNAAQAEHFLESSQRGDVVIRPSSKGPNHLAVTWKVEDKLYQHIDVVDANADPTGQLIGTKLIVDPTHQYSDLDELIVNHVQAMARKVEELMAHEKFKSGPEDELHLFLKNFVAANPSKSAYGFTLNRKRPGHFNLCFLASKNATVQTWPVRVAPEAYYLFETPAPAVPELCDAFKVRHLHETQNFGGAGVSGKTPYGGRTPARTPAGGHTTPGRMSVRQAVPTRTPNPYGGASQHTPAPVPGTTPYGGYQTPGYPGRPPQPPLPPGVPAGNTAPRNGGWGGGYK